MRTHYKFTQYILIFLISSVTLLFAKDNNNNVDKSFNTSYSPAVVKNTNIIEQNIPYKVPSTVSVIALNKFDYHLTNNELVFVWETSKEVNSFVFELQRLNRASNNWEKVGHVVAFGISEEKRTYKLMEEDPLLGITPYRLKIEYLDGKAKYSQVLYVKVKNLFELENKTKYGNLDSPPKNINYLLDKNSRIQISILDSEGNTVAIVMDAYQKEGLYSLLCNLDNLKPGVYFIKMDAEFLANNVALSDTQKIVSLR